jgi:hypothetical protein
MATYSFLSITGVINGPGLSADLGSGAAAAGEGITIEAVGDTDTLTIGADGAPMHSLHADKSGRARIRLLKTSPLNAVLMAAYNAQRADPALHGLNNLHFRDVYRGDDITGAEVAFARRPTVTYAIEGGIMEWEFNIGVLDEVLGSGQLAA